jgi:alpha-ketoglutarate-dependent taurine dioxygenase
MKMTQLTSLLYVSGDTLWASAYEAYDRLSPAYKKFLDGLTATHKGTNFIEIASRTGAIFRENRGSPENVGQSLETVHPVVRTNPVTGWKGLFVNKGFTKKINELTVDESEFTLNYLFDHISAVSTPLSRSYKERQADSDPFPMSEPRSSSTFPMGAQLSCYLGQQKHFP